MSLVQSSSLRVILDQNAVMEGSTSLKASRKSGVSATDVRCVTGANLLFTRSKISSIRSRVFSKLGDSSEEVSASRSPLAWSKIFWTAGTT